MLGPRQSIQAATVAAGAIAIGAFGLAGCGNDEVEEGLASLAPPDTPFYVEAAIQPEGDRAEAITSLSRSIAGIDDPGGRVTALLDSELQSEDVPFTYAEDVEPWLGETGALFIRSFEAADFAGDMADAAVMIEVTDADAASDFLERVSTAGPEARLEERTYEGVDYFTDPREQGAVGLVGDAMVGGTEAAFKAAVDASAGESLAGADDFSEHAGGLDDENLAEMWLDLGTALDAVAESAQADGSEVDAARAAFGPLLEEPLVMELAATEESVTLDTSAAGGTGIAGDTELLAALPAESWLAVAVADAGDTLSRTLAGLGSLGSQLGDPSLDPEAIGSALEAETGLDLDDDVLSWIGDASLFISGTSEDELAGAAILETSDPDASSAVIDAVRAVVEREAGQPVGEPRLEGADDGFALSSPAGGQGFEVALGDGVLVAAMGGADAAADALEPAMALGETELFEAASSALGDGYAASAFVAIQDFLAVAEQGGSGADPDYRLVRPYLDALTYLVAGTAAEDGRQLSRIVLGIEG